MPPDIDETEEERRRRMDPGIKTRRDVHGVPIEYDRHGVRIDQERLENRLLHKVQQRIGQTVFGCVFTVVFGIVTVIVVLAVVAYVGWEVVRSTNGSAGPLATSDAPEVWDGAAPFVCAGNEAVTLDHPAAHFDEGVAVTAEANCKLVLVAPDLSAPTALATRGNAKVNVRGGRLAGTEAAIHAAGLSEVTTSGVSLDGEVRKEGLAKVNEGPAEASP